MMHPKSDDIDPCNPKVDDTSCLQSNQFGPHMHPNPSNSNINNEYEIKNSKSKRKKTIRDKDNRYVCGYCFKSYKYRQGLSKHVKYRCKMNKDESLNELARLLNEMKNAAEKLVRKKILSQKCINLLIN